MKGKKTNVENDLLFSTTKHSALAINLGHLSQNMRVWFSKYAFADGKANRFIDFLFFSKLLYIDYSISSTLYRLIKKKKIMFKHKMGKENAMDLTR